MQPTSDTVIPSATTQPSATANLPTTTRTNAPATLIFTPTTAATDVVPFSVEQLAEQTDISETATGASNLTQTATQWTRTPTSTLTPTITRTPTPDVNASLDAFRTQQTAMAAAQFRANQTATATRWTKTPTVTSTPTNTPTSTPTPTLIPAGTTLTPTIYARTKAKDVSLVYVPRGCFVMGSDQNDDEKPAHEVCITNGFYMGEFEVTNAQFEAYEKEKPGNTRAEVSSFCKSASNDPAQPVVCVVDRGECLRAMAWLPVAHRGAVGVCGAESSLAELSLG